MLRRAKRGAFSMKQVQNERVKRIEWNNVSLKWMWQQYVGSNFAGLIASILVFIKARSLRSLTCWICWTCTATSASWIISFLWTSPFFAAATTVDIRRIVGRGDDGGVDLGVDFREEKDESIVGEEANASCCAPLLLFLRSLSQPVALPLRLGVVC